MENNRDKKDQEENRKDAEFENLSGEEILNRIETDASNAGNPEAGDDDHNKSDLLKKLGLSKKDKLKNENGELKQKVEELNDKYLRLFAEFDNYKKRSHKERIEQSKVAGIEVIISLLPVLDDFSRAIRQMEGNSDAIAQGVRLIYQKFANALEAKGLKQMKSVGEVFNPELHDAISEISVPGEESKGKVVDEIESGYYLNDKIIRHAKVVVGK